MKKQQVKGRHEEAKGKVKAVAGHVAGNEELAAEGKIQRNAGEVDAGIRDVKAEIKNDKKDKKDS